MGSNALGRREGYVLVLEIDDVISDALDAEAKEKGLFSPLDAVKLCIEEQLLGSGKIDGTYVNTKRERSGALCQKNLNAGARINLPNLGVVIHGIEDDSLIPND